MLGFAVAALALYALWVLLSRDWSHASGRSFIEFDRALLYLLAVVLCGSVATTPERLRWMVRGFALATIVVCVTSLATRLFPDAFSVAPNIAVNRLSFPITYWNALGVLAAVGILACVPLTGSHSINGSPQCSSHAPRVRFARSHTTGPATPAARSNSPSADSPRQDRCRARRRRCSVGALVT
jgi:hypothetical protein